VAHAKETACLVHQNDVARGIMDIRAVFETAVEALWTMGKLGTPDDAKKLSTTALLHVILNDYNCPGLMHYITVAATDNNIASKAVHALAWDAYKIASTLHTQGSSGAGTLDAEASSDVFSGTGKATLVAMAALVSFTGRALLLYDVNRDFAKLGTSLKLRVPPPKGCHATLADVMLQPLIVHKN
jgi:hypothetical protein